FWDSDPLTNIVIIPGESFSVGFPGTNSLSVPVSQLSTGLHLLGFRAHDANRSSEIAWLPVQVEDANTLIPSLANFPISDTNNWLVSAEYFWDGDPGTNKAVAVSFAAGETYTPGTSLTPALHIPVPRLPLGVHYL